MSIVYWVVPKIGNCSVVVCKKNWDLGVNLGSMCITINHLTMFIRCSDSNQTKVAYARFDSSDHVEIALHLTNTVMVDRALILVPYPDGQYAFCMHPLSRSVWHRIHSVESMSHGLFSLFCRLMRTVELLLSSSC